MSLSLSCFINLTRYYPGLLRQSLKFLKIASSHKNAVFQAPEFPFMFGIITQRQRHKSKNQKHVVLANDLLYPKVCHIHVCASSPLRKVVSNEGCLKSELFYINQRFTRQRLLEATMNSSHPHSSLGSHFRQN